MNSLIDKLIKSADIISKTSIFGHANYIVTSSKTAAMFRDNWVRLNRIEKIKKIKSNEI